MLGDYQYVVKGSWEVRLFLLTVFFQPPWTAASMDFTLRHAIAELMHNAYLFMHSMVCVFNHGSALLVKDTRNNIHFL